MIRLILSLAAALAAQTSLAGVINVDLNKVDGLGSMEYSGTAAAPDGGTVWNQVATEDGTASRLATSTGATTGVSMQVSGFTGTHDGSANVNMDHEAVALVGDYSFVSNKTGTVTLRGLVPNSTVDLYIYAGGDQPDQNGVIDVGGVVKATTGPDASTTALTEIEDYLVFRGVATSATGTASFTLAPDQSQYAAVNGVQIAGMPNLPQGTPAISEINSIADIDLEGSFLYAVNMTGGDETVGGLAFTSEANAPAGFDLLGTVGRYTAGGAKQADLGDDALNAVMNTTVDDGESGLLGFTLDGLKPGYPYKLQLLLYEPWFEAAGERVFDLFFDTYLMAEDIDIYGQVGAVDSAMLASLEFTATRDSLYVSMSPDTNRGVISGFTLEALPVPEPSSLLLAAWALAGAVLWRRLDRRRRA